MPGLTIARTRSGNFPVIVDASHVVLEVRTAGKSIVNDSTLAPFIRAKKLLIAMPVHAMGLALMSKKAGGRGERRGITGGIPTPIWLNMGIDKLTKGENHQDLANDFVGKHNKSLLIIAFKPSRLVTAAGLSFP